MEQGCNPQPKKQHDPNQTMNKNIKWNKRKGSQRLEADSSLKEKEEGKRVKVSRKSDYHAQKENPLITPFGLIDGRSNSHAAFEQKVQLLRDFKAEFGHLNVPQKPPKKYYKLVDFITKERKFYRAFKEGGKRHSFGITEERIQLLNEIGFDWGLTPEERWDEMFDRIKMFRKEWGHTCVGAFKDSDNRLDELKRWSVNQRKILREFNIKKKAKHEHEQLMESLNVSEDKDESTYKRYQFIPRYFTEEMASKLTGLECDFMNSSEYERGNSCNTCHWYGRLEEYRAFSKRKSNGLMDVVWPERLAVWIRNQQKIYKSVKDGRISSNPIIERNISLLESAGFAFDEKTIEMQEMRQRELRYLTRTKEATDMKPMEALEAATKYKAGLEMKMNLLINKQVKIWEEIQETNRELFHSKKQLEDAVGRVAKDWIGRLIQIKPRGQNKAEGLGIVTNTRAVKIGSCTSMALTMFNIEFVKDGHKEQNLDEIFITTSLKGIEADVVGCEVVVLPRSNKVRHGKANILRVKSPSGTSKDPIKSQTEFHVKYEDGTEEENVSSNFIRSAKYVNLY